MSVTINGRQASVNTPNVLDHKAYKSSPITVLNARLGCLAVK